MKSAIINLRVKPATKQRLKALAHATHRPQSNLAEEAIEAYLELNEWQTNGIIATIAEADGPEAHWTDSEELKAKWEAKRARIA